MTGRLAVRAPDEPVAPHTHGFFHLDDGQTLRYTDIRRFGQMLVLPDDGTRGALRPAGRGSAGSDAAEAFCRQLEGRSAPNQVAAAGPERSARRRKYLRGRKPVASAHASGAFGRAAESRRVVAASAGFAAHSARRYQRARIVHLQLSGCRGEAWRLSALASRVPAHGRTLRALRRKHTPHDCWWTQQSLLSELPGGAARSVPSQGPHCDDVRRRRLVTENPVKRKTAPGKAVEPQSRGRKLVGKRRRG